MPRCAAVGAEPGTILVPSLDCHRTNNFGGLALGMHQVGEQVPVVALDNLKLARCDFLKVDVEGMEKPVLLGASATIARCQPLLYVENDRQDKSADLIRTIDGMGYRMFWHIPPLFSPDNFARNFENVFGNIASFNMFCVHKDNANAKLDGCKPVLVPAP